MQPLLWTLAIALLAGAIAACVLLVSAWRRNRDSKPALPTQWTLTPRPVFSTQERRCYRALREALPHHIILAKLPLVRFCQPAAGEDARAWYDLLGSKHVAMAICSANGRVLAAIDLNSELDDASMRNVQIKLAVMKACGVRYVRCPPDSLPSFSELQLLVPSATSATPGSQASTNEGRADGVLHSLAARRAERATLWQDSTVLDDSFFFVDSRIDSANRSAFGGLYPAAGPVSAQPVQPAATAPAVWAATETLHPDGTSGTDSRPAKATPMARR